jgi:phosphomannomutase
MINQSIFKSYDVRGIYPSELNEEAAFATGKAFVKKTGAKNIVVGFDARLSSRELFEALAKGLLSEGAKVSSIGQVPTEMLYFAVGKYDFDAGIMITASHNPKEYNGFKTMTGKAGTITWIRGRDLAALAQESPVTTGEANVTDKDIWADYTSFIMGFSGDMKPFKVVVDASNGVMGSVISRIANKLPITVMALNFDADGNFPNHSPNPQDKGSNDQIKQAIMEQKADFGFMFDGDGDRLFVVNEHGEMISPDIVLLLLAKHFLAKNPGTGVAYNLICSKSVPEFVKKWGGSPIRTQVGFVNVREGLMNNNGIMGGELSAHYCFRDYFYMDSGIIAFLTLLQIISKEGKTVSEITKDLTLYPKPFQANFKTTDPNSIIEKVKTKYADGKQDFLDGVTVEYSDWWFNLRPSNTEPVIKLTLEANTQELRDQKEKELNDLITH